MSDDVKALIAEAQQLLRAYAGVLALARDDGLDFGSERAWKVADALEAAQVPTTDDERGALVTVLMRPEVPGPPNSERAEALIRAGMERLADRLLAEGFGFRRPSQIPATDDEREALAAELSKHWANMNGKCACGWVHPQHGALFLDAKHFIEHCAEALAAAGFRRSARVPVSQDKLAKFIAEWQATDAAGFGSCNAPRDMAADIADRFDIYPKADCKPADSSNGDERG